MITPQQPGTAYSPAGPLTLSPYSPAMYTYAPQQQQQSGGGFPVSPLLSTAFKKTGLGQSALAGVNSFGQSIGFGAGVQPASFVGPMAPGALGTTSSLGAIGGAAGLGYLGGGLLAKATGGNQTGGSIGGAVGGALGSYAAGTATGLAAGAALGIGAQALNFVVPGLGIIVGGLAGGLLGKKKPGVVVSEYAGMLGEDGSVGNRSIGSKRSGEEGGQSVAQGTEDYFKGLKEATGISFKDTQIRGGIKNGGGVLSVDKRGVGFNPDAELGGDPIAFNFDPNNDDEFDKALGDTAAYLGEQRKLSPEQIQQIKQYNAQRAEQKLRAKNGLQGQSAGLSYGGPMIEGRKASTKESFSSFYTNFKQQQQQGKAV